MNLLVAGKKGQKCHPLPAEFVSSHVIQKREGDEITKSRAHDDTEEDPDIVRHDTKHYHVAHSHLQHVEDCLDNMKQPAEEQRDECTNNHDKHLLQ